MGRDRDKYIEDKKKAWEIFDRIYRKYDLLNHILSFGLDFKWRKKLADQIGRDKNKNLLDLATGTGDVLFSMVRNRGGFKTALGLDMSLNMLRSAVIKSEKSGMRNKIGFALGNANSIPARDNTFDFVTMAFGIRNISNPQNVLKDTYRVLDIGGKMLILEFSIPGNSVLKRVHLIYLRYIIPFLGKIISGDTEAYRYLNQTIETFPYGEAFLELMKQAGFSDCRSTPLTFGVVSIYSGIKSDGR
jgi:demethylmenaquinone methyltransferase/2-methoxy-6-polyprenyl-1,4-benzoquinol methylase